jgi:hypothetical protein
LIRLEFGTALPAVVGPAHRVAALGVAELRAGAAVLAPVVLAAAVLAAPVLAAALAPAAVGSGSVAAAATVSAVILREGGVCRTRQQHHRKRGCDRGLHLRLWPFLAQSDVPLTIIWRQLE